MKKLRIILYEGDERHMARQFRNWREPEIQAGPDTRAGSLADGTHHYCTDISCHTVKDEEVNRALYILKQFALWPVSDEEREQE